MSKTADYSTYYIQLVLPEIAERRNGTNMLQRFRKKQRERLLQAKKNLN